MTDSKLDVSLPYRLYSYWQRGCNDAKAGKRTDAAFLNKCEWREEEGYLNGYKYGLMVKLKEKEKDMDQKIEAPLTPDVEIILKGHKLPYYLDKEVFTFAIAMQNKLNSHNPAKGDSWKDMTQLDVVKRIGEEVVEVVEALQQGSLLTPEGRKKVAEEYTDVALFCMFGATLTLDGLPV